MQICPPPYSSSRTTLCFSSQKGQPQSKTSETFCFCLRQSPDCELTSQRVSSLLCQPRTRMFLVLLRYWVAKWPIYHCSIWGSHWEVSGMQSLGGTQLWNGSGWKGQYLSKRGKLTLIKSVLSNLPAYLMFLFRAPSSVLHHINSLRRAFFWNSIEGGKKYHLVRWSRACQPLEQGGLGIRDLRDMNRALLAEWL